MEQKPKPTEKKPPPPVSVCPVTRTSEVKAGGTEFTEQVVGLKRRLCCIHTNYLQDVSQEVESESSWGGTCSYQTETGAHANGFRPLTLTLMN